MRGRVVAVSIAVIAAVLWAGQALAGNVTALQSIEPPIIALGGSARLTITAVGGETPAITPPMVPGLEFLAVGQSQQVEIINGVASSRTTVTYQVIPQQAGVFTIPSALPGGEPVVLTVNRAAEPRHHPARRVPVKGSRAARGRSRRPHCPPEP